MSEERRIVCETIGQHDVIPMLCQAYPGLRDRLCTRVGEWFREDGSLSLFGLLAVSGDFFVERFGQGEYGHADALFDVVESLLLKGNTAVQTAVATGFLEGLQHQTKLSGELWAPLLGPKARAHCKAMDQFHGAETPGLREDT